jgi:hypothetical protein
MHVSAVVKLGRARHTQITEVVQGGTLDHWILRWWRCLVRVLESLGVGVVVEASIAVGLRHHAEHSDLCARG